MKPSTFILVALAVSSVSVAAIADPASIPMTADQIIAARQAGFSLMGADFGAMKAAIDAGADVKPYSNAAKSIGLWARSIGDLFPPGTDKGHDTQAKPEIWTDTSGFQKAAQQLALASSKLAQTAESGDKASFAEQFKATGKACGECHRTYRVRQPE